MSPLEECCYFCAECGLKTCRDERPSPREDQRICDDCSDLVDGLAGWGATS